MEPAAHRPRETLPGNKQTSLGRVRVWNLKSNWVISTCRAHPTLVSDADFLAAQAVRATCAPYDDERRHRLTGLLICGTCGRRLHPHWVHGRAAYRCRHGHTSAHPAGDRPRWIYWPERRILTEALDQLTRGAQLAAHAGLDGLLAHLHGRDAVIVCDAATLSIDVPGDESAAEIQPRGHAREH